MGERVESGSRPGRIKVWSSTGTCSTSVEGLFLSIHSEEDWKESGDDREVDSSGLEAGNTTSKLYQKD
ncbi:MAG: hypothetical protein ACYC9S_02495 [Leptospirales bacterium]